MTAPTLCPSTLNELGKGIFSPEREARLLADGYIFACHIRCALVGGLLKSRRPIADAVTDMEMDDPRQYRRPAPVAAATPAS